jgi:hypothetical protein
LRLKNINVSPAYVSWAIPKIQTFRSEITARNGRNAWPTAQLAWKIFHTEIKNRLSSPQNGNLEIENRFFEKLKIGTSHLKWPSLRRGGTVSPLWRMSHPVDADFINPRYAGAAPMDRRC